MTALFGSANSLRLKSFLSQFMGPLLDLDTSLHSRLRHSNTMTCLLDPQDSQRLKSACNPLMARLFDPEA